MGVRIYTLKEHVLKKKMVTCANGLAYLTEEAKYGRRSCWTLSEFYAPLLCSKKECVLQSRIIMQKYKWRVRGLWVERVALGVVWKRAFM